MCLQIVMEHIALAKNARVFRIKAEHQADAQRIQTLERLLGFWFCVLFKQRIIQNTNEFACLQRYFHLFANIFIACVHEEIQPRIFFFEV